MLGKCLDCKEEGGERGDQQRVEVSTAAPAVYYRVLHPEQRRGRTRNICASVLLGAVHLPWAQFWAQEPSVQYWN